MSKQNKANRNNYMQAGRLTPDDIARLQLFASVLSGSRSARLDRRHRQYLL